MTAPVNINSVNINSVNINSVNINSVNINSVNINSVNINSVNINSGGGPTPFLYMATRFLANVHVQNVQNVQKLFFPVWKFPGKIYLLWLIHNDRYITWECI